MNMKAAKLGLRTEVQGASNCTVTGRLATGNLYSKPSCSITNVHYH